MSEYENKTSLIFPPWFFNLAQINYRPYAYRNIRYKKKPSRSKYSRKKSFRKKSFRKKSFRKKSPRKKSSRRKSSRKKSPRKKSFQKRHWQKRRPHMKSLKKPSKEALKKRNRIDYERDQIDIDFDVFSKFLIASISTHFWQATITFSNLLIRDIFGGLKGKRQ